ncbi:MAG: hypothetical protein JWM10_3199 [Myxococcaceae bacterium]|nr:hypothetical protein [Myxococcaceae bacterium]
MSALFEADKVTLPASPTHELGGGEEDPRGMVDTFVSELHGLGREGHDDWVMCMWAGETWARRFIRTEERRRKLKRPTPDLTRLRRVAGRWTSRRRNARRLWGRRLKNRVGSQVDQSRETSAIASRSKAASLTENVSVRQKSLVMDSPRRNLTSSG